MKPLSALSEARPALRAILADNAEAAGNQPGETREAPRPVTRPVSEGGRPVRPYVRPYLPNLVRPETRPSVEAQIAERVENASEEEIRDIRRRDLFDPANLDSGELAILEANPRSNLFRPEHIPDSVRNDETPGLHERIANTTQDEVREIRERALLNPANLDTGDLAILAVESERLTQLQESNPASLDGGDLIFINSYINRQPLSADARAEIERGQTGVNGATPI